MHNLIEFIKSHFHWVMFVLLESAAIVLLFRFNDYQASIWFTSANEFTAAVDRTYADVVSYIKLGKINSDLTARNIMLPETLIISSAYKKPPIFPPSSYQSIFSNHSRISSISSLSGCPSPYNAAKKLESEPECISCKNSSVCIFL